MSEDGGRTVRRIMVWNDVPELASCPDDEVVSVCADTKFWDQWQTDFIIDSKTKITPAALGDPPIWPPQTSSGPQDAGTPDHGDAGPGSNGGGGAGGTGSTPDAGSTTPVPKGEGCDCTVASDSRSAPWSVPGWLLLAMIALLGRRKRAR